MASPVAISSVLAGMANQLAVMLNTGGKKGKETWENLHGKLAGLAIRIADPAMTIESLLKKLREIGSPKVLGYPDAEVLLGQMMKHVEEKVSAQSAADASQAIPLLQSLVVLVARQLNMTPLCNSVHVEMIDGDAAFKQKEVDYMVSSSVELSDPNTPYTVVSIVGLWTSGKTSLLNHLFGTKFPVRERDPHRRWEATTGILISRCIEPSMLVLDTNGFDGTEKGKDTSFENRVILFALTVSDIMMVNVSVYDIGPEGAAGTSLLRTIFRERTKLPPVLTNIIVVFRHYDGETRLEILRQKVMESVVKIWRSVNKESTIFTDNVQINVVGLPEKNSVAFQKEVTALRMLLMNFTSSAKVPASSFPPGCKMLWDLTKQNKKFDFLAHMILRPKLYCQQTVEACMGQVSPVPT